MSAILKVLGVFLAILLLIFFTFIIVNTINEAIINNYIDSFETVADAERLTPSYDENGTAYFVTDGDFKVLQLTDIHLGGGFMSNKTDKQTINAIAAMIQKEKPDLVIATGDISFAVPYISGTINNAYAHRMFCRIMERLGVYWTVTFGNHDSEAYNYHNRETVAEMYADENLKFCLFSPDGDISGEGNHAINVKNSKGFITESFYMIDTHAYTENDPFGLKWDYDYVKEDQIAWYEACVKNCAAENAEVYNALPEEIKEEYQSLLSPKSLMFIHIPLREVKIAYDEFVNNGRQNTENVQFIEGNDGEVDEVVYCSRTDENLFEKILELGSTSALFFGHDHYNNFVLNYKGIILSYGYSLDYLAYDGIENEGYQRGCTSIVCSQRGDTSITHENYYQEKYTTQYEKEDVDMSKQ